MEILKIESTKYTPEIYFDAEKNILSIIGESYPENTADFYAPVFSWLKKYLRQAGNETITVHIELTYFNSSSSKILLDFFDMFEEATSDGRQIMINWVYEKEDEETHQYGEEFQEDFESLTFNCIQK
ncbi:MAG: hypothetical protein BWK80_27360 [Desulfobacteraceae bacterium IS3]|nr:MAG: hypothetical protein BWK80_27360 [Desulfobacteraceae bacterium IS3]